MFGSIIGSVGNTLSDLVDDPLGATIDLATAPVRDTLEVLEGLSEGELRIKAAARVGADVASGMAVSEIINMLSED